MLFQKTAFEYKCESTRNIWERPLKRPLNRQEPFEEVKERRVECHNFLHRKSKNNSQIRILRIGCHM
jgi:hypothetical protein